MSLVILFVILLVDCQLSLDVIGWEDYQWLVRRFETSVNVISNSPSQDYTHPDDRTLLNDMTPGFKPFTRLQFAQSSQVDNQHSFTLLRLKMPFGMQL